MRRLISIFVSTTDLASLFDGRLAAHAARRDLQNQDRTERPYVLNISYILARRRSAFLKNQSKSGIRAFLS